MQTKNQQKLKVLCFSGQPIKCLVNPLVQQESEVLRSINRSAERTNFEFRINSFPPLFPHRERQVSWLACRMPSTELPLISQSQASSPIEEQQCHSSLARPLHGVGGPLLSATGAMEC